MNNNGEGLTPLDARQDEIAEAPAYYCKRCGQTLGDRDEAEGCRDYFCLEQEPSNA